MYGDGWIFASSAPGHDVDDVVSQRVMLGVGVHTTPLAADARISEQS